MNDDVADELTSQLEPAGGYPDDVAILLYRQPAPLEMDFDRQRPASGPEPCRFASGEAGLKPNRSRHARRYR